MLQFEERSKTDEGLKVTNEKVVKKREEEEGNERDEKFVVSILGQPAGFLVLCHACECMHVLCVVILV